MALLNENKNYIKLFNDEDTNYIVYDSEEHRNKLKSLKPYDTIIREVKEKANKKASQLEKMLNYNNIQTEEGIKVFAENNEKFKKDLDYLNSLIYELNCYEEEIRISKGHSLEIKYNILEKMYKGIEDTVPNIIEGGYAFIKGDSVDKMYENAKEGKLFGETVDC